MWKKFKSSLERFPRFLFLGSLIFCLCLSQFHFRAELLGIGAVAIAQSPDVNQLVQQGIERYNLGNFQGAIQFWQKALSTTQQGNSLTNEQITVLKYLTRAYQQVGQVEQAIAHIDRVITYYRQSGDELQVGRMLTEQAQIYSSQGQHKRAIALLCAKNTVTLACEKNSALEIARTESDSLGEAAANGSLGNAYRLQGQYDLATLSLNASLEIAKKIKNQSYILAALNSLGNVSTSLAKRNFRYAQYASVTGDKRAIQRFKENASSYDNKAVEYFKTTLSLARSSGDRTAQLRALLNLVVPYQRHLSANSQALVNNTIEQAIATLKDIPDSQEKVYGAIKLASFLQASTLEPTTFDGDSVICPTSEIHIATELLNEAVVIAQRIQDKNSESFALGRLGHFYECRRDYQQALNLTQQALLVGVNKESLYQWEWQAGRILKVQGRKLDAINAYQRAVEMLRSIRGDIALASRDFQLDFRDTVEPVYRQLTELWLDSTLNSTKTVSDPHKNLESALSTINELRLAELQNYLGDECELPAIEKPVALLDRSTAVLNSIILKDRIAIILTLPNNKESFQSQIHWIPTKSTELLAIINDFRLKIEKRSDRSNSYRERSIQLYDWLIRPFVSDLEAAKIKTLVFIHDGILRSIPMAALYDGKQFLLQKYAIAYTPSLTLTNPARLDSKDSRVLAFGLTKPSEIVETGSPLISVGEAKNRGGSDVQVFPPLENVRSEIKSIQATIPGSKGFLDEDFTRDRLKQEVEKNTYPLLHIATHGKFGIDPRDTFLVTGDVDASKLNKTLSMNQLYQIVKSIGNGANQIELLTLSACETAAGSDRDALGIAGIALQAGVQSAMASLWQVDDAATAQIITQFYQGLRQGLSRAEALQATQRAWLEANPKGRYNHPGYWAAFVLLGNWL